MDEQCIAPLEIQEGDLLAYLEGVAPPAIAGHVARCPACAAQAAALREMELLMAGALHRADCPDPDDLLQYQAGLLARADQRRVKRHIAACNDCQAELGQLAALTAPPPTPTAKEIVQQAGRRILRALQLPAAPAPAFAVRGDERRWLEYQAGGYRLLLGVVPLPAVEMIWQLEGQLLRLEDALPTPQGAAVRILQGDDPTVIAQDIVDEFGFFALDRLGPGRYIIQIDLDADSIVIEDIAIA